MKGKEDEGLGEKDEKDLYIPVNCSPLNYIIEGFTAKEIAYIGIAIVAAAILAVSIYIANENSFLAVLLAGVIICAAIMFFRKDAYSENCADKIRLLIEFRRTPKRYTYKYVNIYEKTKEGAIEGTIRNGKK